MEGYKISENIIIAKDTAHIGKIGLYTIFAAEFLKPIFWKENISKKNMKKAISILEKQIKTNAEKKFSIESQIKSIEIIKKALK